MPNYDDPRATMVGPAETRLRAAGYMDENQDTASKARLTVGQKEVSLPSIPGILYDRRSYHLDRVALALADLTAALDAASDDGFDIRYNSGQPEVRSLNATIPPSQPPARFPRGYEVDLSVTFNQPF